MQKKYFILLNLILIFSISAKEYTNGKDYITLPKQKSTLPKIVEYFSFFCKYCYEFEKKNQIYKKIRKELPKNISIKKYHVELLGGKLEKLVNHAWAIAIALGVEKKVILPIFSGIQKTHTITNEINLKNIFTKAAHISLKKYELAWNSFSIKILIKKQKKETKNLQWVPTIVINEKYIINNSKFKNTSYKKLSDHYLKIIKFLIYKK